MNHSTSTLWSKLQPLRTMRWPWTRGCGKVSRVRHIGRGERDTWLDAICVEIKMKSTKVKMKSIWKAGLEGRVTSMINSLAILYNLSFKIMNICDLTILFTPLNT